MYKGISPILFTNMFVNTGKGKEELLLKTIYISYFF